MYPRIDSSLLVIPPLEVALFAAERSPYVGPVPKGTQLRRFLAGGEEEAEGRPQQARPGRAPHWKGCSSP
eukprot:scaffold165_cov207-Pinguiococcus_pyrenoidosus.AAC.2